MTILDDNLVEGTESFIVEITSASGAIVSDGIARFTIRDGNESPDRRSVEFSPVSLSNNVFTEASGTADVAIKLFGSADQVTNVSVRSYPISATEDVDYTGITQIVTFLPGDREALVSIPITQDQDVEPGETLGLQITNVSGGVVRDIDDSETLVIILDDDEVAATPSLLVDDVSVSEGDGTVQVPIRLLQASGQPVSVSVFTRNVDAVGGQDFYGFTQSVTIPAGATTASVSLTLLDDALPENTETLELRLFNPQGAVLADAVGVITITDNDVITTPGLSIDDVNVSEGDGTVQVPISLSQASAQQ